ncbi:MAG: hypothetical protein DRP50_08795, partial [Thermotoga sp.]
WLIRDKASKIEVEPKATVPKHRLPRSNNKNAESRIKILLLHVIHIFDFIYYILHITSVNRIRKLNHSLDKILLQ